MPRVPGHCVGEAAARDGQVPPRDAGPAAAQEATEIGPLRSVRRVRVSPACVPE